MPASCRAAHDQRADLVVCGTETGVMYPRGVPPEEGDDVVPSHPKAEWGKHGVAEIIQHLRGHSALIVERRAARIA